MAPLMKPQLRIGSLVTPTPLRIANPMRPRVAKRVVQANFQTEVSIFLQKTGDDAGSTCELFGNITVGTQSQSLDDGRELTLQTFNPPLELLSLTPEARKFPLPISYTLYEDGATLFSSARFLLGTSIIDPNADDILVDGLPHDIQGEEIDGYQAFISYKITPV